MKHICKLLCSILSLALVINLHSKFKGFSDKTKRNYYIKTEKGNSERRTPHF